MMNVKELILALECIADKELQVLIPGYESGSNTIRELALTTVWDTKGKLPYYDGRFQPGITIPSTYHYDMETEEYTTTPIPEVGMVRAVVLR